MDIYKGLIGEEDFNRWDGTGSPTFTRQTSTGGTVMLTKVGYYQGQNANTYEYDAKTYGDSFSSATIDAALTAIGTTTQATLFLRPGTWTISANKDWSAYTNITFKIPRGAFISRGAYTITLPTVPEAGLYQIFLGTGTVTIPGEKYPEWFGAKDDSGTTDNTAAMLAALASGGTIKIKAPSGGYYKITDDLNVTVAGTKIISDNKAEIRQTVAGKKAFNITVSNVDIKNLTLTGLQHAAYNTGETAVYATGTSDSVRITDITVNDCVISNWGWEAIRFDYVTKANARNNRIYDIVYSGIQGRNTNEVDFSHNHIVDIGPGSASGVIVGVTLDGSVSQATASKYGRISDNYIYNTKQAILLEPAEHITISNNVLLDNLTGIDVKYHTTGGVSKNVTVTGNSIINLSLTTTQQKGIDVAGYDSTTLTENVSATGNVIYGYGSTADSRGAIQTGNITGCNFIGNIIANAQKYPLLIGSYTKNTNFIGNTIYGMQIVVGSTAMYVGLGCDYTFIDSNNIQSGAYPSITVPAASPLLLIGTNYYNTSAVTPIGTLSGTNASLKRLVVGSTATVTGAATGDLKSHVFTQNSVPNGMVIHFRAAGTKTGATGNKQINIVWGSATYTVHAAANNTNDWRVEGEILFTAAGAQSISWKCWDGATVTQGYEAGAQDISAGDVTLKLQAVVSGAADTVVQRMWVVERQYQ